MPDQGLTKDQALSQYGNDFTGIQQKGDLYYPDSSAIARRTQRDSTPKPAQSSGTTFSNYTAINQYVPENNARLDKLTNSGTYMDQQGNLRYSDGSLSGQMAEAPMDTTYQNGKWHSDAQSQDYSQGPHFSDDPTSNALFQSMKAQSDVATKAQMDAIEASYKVRQSAMEDVNKRAQADKEQALILGGSERYAPISSAGAMQAEENYGLQQLAALDAEKQGAIAKVKAAQQSGNQQLMSKALDEAETKQKQVWDAAQKHAEQVAANTKKIQEQGRQASRDGAISDLINQGVKNPTEILDYLNYDDNGKLIGDFTMDEVAKITKLLPQEKAPRTQISNIDGNQVMVNLDTGEQKVLGKSSTGDKTQLITSGNSQQLIDMQTGKVIADFGEKKEPLKTQVVTIGTRQKLIDLTDGHVISDLGAKAAPGTAAHAQTKQTAIKNAGEAFSIHKEGLNKDKTWDGYEDPDFYQQMRQRYAEITGEVKTFDDTFASKLSPEERTRILKTPSPKAASTKKTTDSGSLY